MKISEISKCFADFFLFFCRKFVTYVNKIRKAGKTPAKTKKGKSLKTKQQKRTSCKHRLNKFEKYKLVSNIQLVINRKFPDLVQKLSELPDYRKRPRYQVNELIVSGLLIFLFKQGSRNQADNTAKNIDYQDNIKKIFGIKVADTDTVDKYLRFLPPQELTNIKKSMINAIVSSKTLNKHKFQGKFMVAIDGTGLQSFDYEPYPSCPFKKYKSGKKVWTTYVLEAKIVSPNGFSLSLSSVWVENPADKEFVKQDSEYKAFIRLTTQLKKEFPRLPMMFLLDGLYPKDPIFKICKENNWGFIITLKDKVLKSVQEQIADKNLFNEYTQTEHISKKGFFWLKNSYRIYENINYKEHYLSVIETKFCKKHEKRKKEEHTRFVHITNIKTNTNNAHKVSSTGRLRWKIENEGFNNQKNNDYNLSHKFSRKSFNATKNYYQLLQIADIINQFTYKLKQIQKYIKQYGYTLKSLIQYILSLLKAMLFSDSLLITNILEAKQQLLY